MQYVHMYVCATPNQEKYTSQLIIGKLLLAIGISKWQLAVGKLTNSNWKLAMGKLANGNWQVIQLVNEKS